MVYKVLLYVGVWYKTALGLSREVSQNVIAQAGMAKYRVLGSAPIVANLIFSLVVFIWGSPYKSVPGDLFYLCLVQPISMRCHASQ